MALAIQLNDIATSKPLTRGQRNEGVKLLLASGWAQDHVAEATGIARHTIGDIANSLAMRGMLPKKGGGKGTPKAVAALPSAVHERLADTTLVRIAEMVPLDQQVEFATAVADAGLSEPRVREAAKALRSNGHTPREAVASMTPTIVTGVRPIIL